MPHTCLRTFIWSAVSALAGHGPDCVAQEGFDGDGANYKEALRLLEKASATGLAEAQSDLAFMYSTGLGTPRDTALVRCYLCTHNLPRRALVMFVHCSSFSSFIVIDSNLNITYCRLIHYECFC